jgi:linoleate 10R-lipoxygenase
MKESLTRQGIAKKYTFDRPTPLRAPKVLNTFTGIKYVFGDPSRFKIIYERVGYGSVLMFDDVQKYVHISCDRLTRSTDLTKA